MLKIAIVDDDSVYIEALKAHIEIYQSERKLNIEINVFSSGLQLITDYEPNYDILFLDIEMPHMDGMELARSIRKSDPYVVIVFVTNMAQYAVKGYEVNAFDYMVKPIDYTHFAVKFGAAIEAVNKRENFGILIPWEDGTRQMNVQEIFFIEVRDHWLYIYSPEGEFQMLGSLKEMEEQLVDHHFIRCNKSCLINLQYVTKMRSDVVVMQSGHKLSISRARRKEVQNVFIDYYSEMRW